MDREIVFQKLKELAEKDNPKEVLWACAKALYCINLDKESEKTDYCLDNEQCGKILHKILQ